MVRESARACVQSLGYDTITAEDGVAGYNTILQCLNNLPQGGVLRVITDTNMPNMNGIDMLNEFLAFQKDARRKLHIAVMSGKKDRTAEVDNFHCVFLAKPFVLQDLKNFLALTVDTATESVTEKLPESAVSVAQ